MHVQITWSDHPCLWGPYLSRSHDDRFIRSDLRDSNSKLDQIQAGLQDRQEKMRLLERKLLSYTQRLTSSKATLGKETVNFQVLLETESFPSFAGNRKYLVSFPWFAVMLRRFINTYPSRVKMLVLKDGVTSKGKHKSAVNHTLSVKQWK